MKNAYCYGVWGDFRYYRTEDGHTFSVKPFNGKKKYFYHGNVNDEGNYELKILSDSEVIFLLNRIKFIDD